MKRSLRRVSGYLRLIVRVFLFVPVLAGCGAAVMTPPASPSPTGASASPIPTAALSSVSAPYRTIKADGQFLFAPGDGSLWLQDAATFQSKPLLKATQDVYYEAPAFSPDGGQVVYVAYTFGADGAQIKELDAVNIDGSNPHPLYKTPDSGPTISFGDPRYSQDGKSLYFTATTLTGTGAAGRKIQAARGPANGGDWKVVIADGQQPVPSPDGARIAFLKFNPQRFASSLWIANADGGNPQQLVADNVFAGINGQRFSPDGQWIVFAASGAPRNKLPGMTLRGSPQRPCSFLACLVPAAFADGLPWDIWLVSADGKLFKQLTALGMDSPDPTFSRDGRYIAFVSISGLFIYDRQTSDLSQLDRARVHGVLDWFQK
ncbi:MAG: hypothetical protein WCF84_00525 [Anaerolineae bacterium]